jgi:hypothetical protein
VNLASLLPTGNGRTAAEELNSLKEGEEGIEAMMFLPGGPGPPGPRECARAIEKTPPNQTSWFGARLRVTSARCRLADELFRLAWRARHRAPRRSGAGAGKKPGAETKGA